METFCRRLEQVNGEAQVVADVAAAGVALRELFADIGAEIIVTNPSPIRWGGPENKTDAQLRTQARALDRLGAALRQRGLTLAYHNHDPELRQGARELHHMLVGTDPAHVTYCLDAHWVFRGAGDSQVALFDVVHLYADRITELHLRQSVDGVWSETFGPGDIDYERLVEAHRASLAYAAEVFAPAALRWNGRPPYAGRPLKEAAR